MASVSLIEYYGLNEGDFGIRLSGFKPQALLLSGRRRWSVYLYTYTVGKPLSVLTECTHGLTEVGSPMMIRVNTDVILGSNNDQWSTPI